jgi:uncharacterized protein with GYD domain
VKTVTVAALVQNAVFAPTGMGGPMPRYLIAANYTAQGEQGVLSKGGSARRESVTASVEKLGGKVKTFDFAFGEDDVFTVIELPDNVTAAALALAIGASGLTTVRTTVLLTPEDIDAAAQIHAEYHGPGQD